MVILTRIILWSLIIFLMQFTENINGSVYHFKRNFILSLPINAMSMTVNIIPNWNREEKFQFSKRLICFKWPLTTTTMIIMCSDCLTSDYWGEKTCRCHFDVLFEMLFSNSPRIFLHLHPIETDNYRFRCISIPFLCRFDLRNRTHPRCSLLVRRFFYRCLKDERQAYEK